jgi:predicted transposase YbfD/YdcC
MASHVVPGQVAVADNSNEITAISVLLTSLALAETTVTMETRGQAEITKQILD